MPPSYSLQEIATLLQSPLERAGNTPIQGIASLEQATADTISFLSDTQYEKYIYDTQAAAVIVQEGFQPHKPLHTLLLRVQNVHASLGRLLDKLAEHMSEQKVGVETPAYVGENTQIGQAVYRGAFSYIGHHVHIGAHVKIYPHVYIGDHVAIGDHTTLYAGAKVHARTRIGQHCTLHEGAVVGCEGFGFTRRADGSYKTLPHIGNAVLEDHVSIGANTTVDRAMFASTRLQQGVIIDNLVQIGHNVEVGAHSAMAAQVGIAGSARIGQQVVIGGQAGLSGHIHIASRTSIAPQAGVTKSVREEGTTIIGGPARPYRRFIKDLSNMHKIEALLEKVAALEKHCKSVQTVKA